MKYATIIFAVLTLGGCFSEAKESQVKGFWISEQKFEGHPLVEFIEVGDTITNGSLNVDYGREACNTSNLCASNTAFIASKYKFKDQKVEFFDREDSVDYILSKEYYEKHIYPNIFVSDGEYFYSVEGDKLRLERGGKSRAFVKFDKSFARSSINLFRSFNVSIIDNYECFLNSPRNNKLKDVSSAFLKIRELYDEREALSFDIANAMNQKDSAKVGELRVKGKKIALIVMSLQVADFYKDKITQDEMDSILKEFGISDEIVSVYRAEIQAFQNSGQNEEEYFQSRFCTNS